LDTKDIFQDFVKVISDNIFFYDAQGVLGLISGLLIFCSLMLIFRFEQKKQDKSINIPNNLKDLGDPVEAEINIARSLIEMKKTSEAIDILEKIKNKNISSVQKETLKNLLTKANAI
tara:strand:- start:4082 stop:4432 length:351 start_codon:yes stop_codon:yes gene_type:complete